MYYDVPLPAGADADAAAFFCALCLAGAFVTAAAGLSALAGDRLSCKTGGAGCTQAQEDQKPQLTSSRGNSPFVQGTHENRTNLAASWRKGFNDA